MPAQPQTPYFLRALYEWCVDCGYTPYILVRADGTARVPKAYVRNGQIVLNISPGAVRDLVMDNEWVAFSARFGGQAQTIEVPVGNILSIYARETGEGMAFSEAMMTSAGSVAESDAADPVVAKPVAPVLSVVESNDETRDDVRQDGPSTPRPSGRPGLKIVK